MKKIQMYGGRFAVVDDEDFDFINQWTWVYHNRGYAYRYEYSRKRGMDGEQSRRRIFMHHLIVGRMPGLETDHINRNKLDNRRSNLRNVTRAENMRNRATRSKSGIKNIYPSDKNWIVKFSDNYKPVYVGYFTTLKSAIKARDEAMKNFAAHP